jgi:flagellar motility protein MotE (MotC chaperone)
VKTAVKNVTPFPVRPRGFADLMLRPSRLFTALSVLLALAFLIQLCTVISFRTASAQGSAAPRVAVSKTGGGSTTTGGTAATSSNSSADTSADEPPPLTQEEINKAVKETARKTDDEAGSSVSAPAPASTSATTSSPAAPMSKPAPHETAAPPPMASFSASEIEVLQSLSKRRDELDRREKRVAEKEALLSAAEQEVDHKIAELNKLKGEIESLLGQQQKMQSDRIQSLVKIYEGMKPKEAAAIFNTLDMEVLLPVISRMNERKSGPILAAMNPDKARIVTIRLAQQRELPGAAMMSKHAESAPPPLPLPAAAPP